MRTIVFAMSLLYGGQAAAEGELYLDVGVGQMWGVYRAEPSAPAKELPPPHATVEIGYAFGNTSVFAAHVSSLPDDGDRGIEIVGIKHRFSVKVP